MRFGSLWGFLNHLVFLCSNLMSTSFSQIVPVYTLDLSPKESYRSQYTDFAFDELSWWWSLYSS